MGLNHLRYLRRDSKVKRIFLFDKNPVVLNNLKTYDNEIKLKNFKEFEKTKMDYLVVAVPSNESLNICMTLPINLKGILLEKPGFNDSKNFKAFKEHLKCTNARIVVGIGYIERHNPVFKALKNFFSENPEVKPISIITYRAGGGNFYINRELDLFTDLISHDLDLILQLTGEDFNFITANNAAQNTNQYPDGYSHTVQIVGKLESGILINLFSNCVSPIKIRKMYIWCNQGLISIDYITNSFEYIENDLTLIKWDDVRKLKGDFNPVSRQIKINLVEPLELEHQEFRQFLHGGKNNFCTLVEAERLMELIEKAKCSIL